MSSSLNHSPYGANSPTPVTVIIPTFERANFLPAALDGILAQDWPAERIICVDDGSADDTPRVLSAYAGRVEWLKQRNAGKAAALNNAMRLVTSNFIWFFDDDDVAYRHAISTLLPRLLEDQQLAISYGDADYGHTVGTRDIELTRPHSPDAALRGSLETQRIALFRRSTFHLGGAIIRTSAALQTGAFREDMTRSQDYEFLVRVAAKHPIAYANRSVYVQRVHDGIRGPRHARSSYSERNRVWRKMDALIGEFLLNHLPLEDFAQEIPGLILVDETITSVPQRRFARITRAWTLATKSALAAMVRDLLSAFSGDDSDSPLSSTENARLAELLNNDYCIHSIAESPFTLLPLRQLGNSRAGRTALMQLAKGLYWQSRTPLALRVRVVAWTIVAYLLLHSVWRR